MLSATVTCLYHRHHKKGHFVVFSRRDRYPTVYPFVEGTPFDIELKSDRDVSYWIYIQRTVDDESKHVVGDPEVKVPTIGGGGGGGGCYCHPKHKDDARCQLQMYSCRIGTAFTTRVGTGELEFYDASRYLVAHTKFTSASLSKVAKMEVRDILFEWTKETKQLSDRFNRAFDDFSSTNIPKSLGMYHFATVTLPCGEIPSWAFVYWRYRHSKQIKNDYYQDMFNRFYYLACFYMFKDPVELMRRIDTQTPAFTAELIAEMQTQETRAILYDADTSLHQGGETSIEDWSYLADQVDIPRIALDCEDMAIHVTERSYQLKFSKFTKPWLLSLQVFEKRYNTYFAIVTLDIMGKLCYHAIVIKLDARYNFEKTTGLLPSVLVDSTIYSASCASFDDGRGQESEDCYARSQETGWPWSSQTKVPTSRIQKQRPYGHVLMLFCPERRDAVRMDLLDASNNWRGVPINTLLNYESCVVHKTAFTPSALNRFKYMPMHRPTATVSPHIPVTAVLHGSVTSHPLIDLTFRLVDWEDPRVLATLEHDPQLKGREIHIFKHEITKDLHAVRVLVWD